MLDSSAPFDIWQFSLHQAERKGGKKGKNKKRERGGKGRMRGESVLDGISASLRVYQNQTFNRGKRRKS
jgi:hypothetical protein